MTAVASAPSSPAEQLLTTHLDLWSSALKRKSTAGRGSSSKMELYGIKKLRELILELAVHGLLVPQDPTDEPASELLKKIAAEKVRLIKEKRIRNSKPLAPIADEEKFMLLPTGWAFVRLNDIGDWGAGATPSRNNPELYGGSIPWFKSGELSADYISQSEETVTELALEKSSLRFNKVGDVLIAMYGATIGKTAILSVPATTNQAVCACTPFSGIENIYLLTLLKAYKPRFIGMGAGGAQPNISREKIIETVIALPPLAEQHRIVAKVDELMVLCDQLERETEDHLGTHQALVSTLLDALTCVAASEDFERAWKRLAEHFDTLFTTEESIDQLKQTILQLAVMGKLVPQDPNDEPASELLKKIATERDLLLRDRKTKYRDFGFHPDIEKTLYEIPESWIWAKFPDAVFFQEGPGIRVWQFTDAGTKLLNVSNILPTGALDFSNSDKFVSASEYNSKYTHFKICSGDLLFAGSGGSWGKSSWFIDPGFDVMLNTSTIRVRFFSEKFSGEYLKYFLDTNHFKQQLIIQMVGIQPNFGSTHLGRAYIPLPPLAEQHRIVAKAKELITLCDQLKASLSEAQSTQLHLADALAEKALARA